MRIKWLLLALAGLAAALGGWLLLRGHGRATHPLTLTTSYSGPRGSLQPVPSNDPFSPTPTMYRAPGQQEFYSAVVSNTSGQPLQLRITNGPGADPELQSEQGLERLASQGWSATAFWVRWPRSQWTQLRRGGLGLDPLRLPHLPLQRTWLQPGESGQVAVRITNRPLRRGCRFVPPLPRPQDYFVPEMEPQQRRQAQRDLARDTREAQQGQPMADLLLHITRPRVRGRHGRWRWPELDGSQDFFAPQVLLAPRCPAGLDPGYASSTWFGPDQDRSD